MRKLDLRAQEFEFRDFLATAVHKFADRQRATQTAGKHPPVTRVDLTFSLGECHANPWVHLNFDTKPGAEPDGNPTHPDFARLPRHVWLRATRSVCNGASVEVTLRTGKVKICDSRNFDEVIGSFLVEMLLEARRESVFSELILAAHCELGVEDPMTGEFGWPNHEDRGKENLLTSVRSAAKSSTSQPTTIDEYIEACTPEVRPIMQKIRETIQKAAPGAQECISYRLAAFFLDGALVYFGAFKEHIGFYPPVRDKILRRAAARYAGEKGNLKFPLDKPIPYSLIRKLVRARVKENQARSAAKKSRKRR